MGEIKGCNCHNCKCNRAKLVWWKEYNLEILLGILLLLGFIFLTIIYSI